MARKAQKRHDPFFDFINFNLDMEGVDGVSFETVALVMREVIQNLPSEQGGDMWGDQLDRLQATLRMALAIETIQRMTEENPQLTKYAPQELELIVNLSISLAYICYNDLASRLGFETDELKESRSETAQLWAALRAASGWVEQAAANGDSVAKNMSSEIIHLLETIRPAGWNNNTRTLKK